MSPRTAGPAPAARSLLVALAGALIAALSLALWWGGEAAVDDTVFAGGARDRSGRSEAADARRDDSGGSQPREDSGASRSDVAIARPVPVPKHDEFLVRVLDGVTGEPVVGADVCADDPSYRYQRLGPEQRQLARRLVGEFARAFHLGQHAVTDASGHALLRSKDYLLVHARHGELYGSAYAQHASETDLVEVRLVPDPSVRVLAVDAGGRPLEGVPVHLAFEAVEPGALVGTYDSDLKGYTDAEGQLHIRELAFLQDPASGTTYRNLRVFVGAHGLADVSAPVTLQSPAGDPAVLRLTAWGSLRIKLRDASGKPVPAADVEGDHLNLFRRGSGESEPVPDRMHAVMTDGCADFPYLGLGIPLAANHWGRHVRAEQEFAGPVAHGEHLAVDLTVERGTGPVAEGRLRAEAELLAKVDWVAVRRAADDEHIGWFGVGADGLFRWTFDRSELDASGKVRFLLAGDSMVLATTDVVTVPPALERVDLGEVPVLPLQQVAAGRLVTAEPGMRPRARLTVMSLDADGDWNQATDHRVTLSEDGAFVVHAVREQPELRRRLLVSNREYEPVEPVEFRTGDDALLVSLVRSSRLDVRVLLDPGLAGIASLTIGAHDDTREVEQEAELRDGALVASLRGFRPGEVTVRVLLGARELARVERVAVTPRGSIDPRLDPLDLRGKVHPLRVRLLDARGNVADLSASVQLRVPPQLDWDESNWLEHGVFQTLVPSTQAEFVLLSHELRPVHWSGRVGNVELQAAEPFTVEFVLDGIEPASLRPDLLLSSELKEMPKELRALQIDGRYWLHDEMAETLVQGRARGTFLVDGTYNIKVCAMGEQSFSYAGWKALHTFEVEVRSSVPTMRLAVPAEVAAQLRAVTGGR